MYNSVFSLISTRQNEQPGNWLMLFVSLFKMRRRITRCWQKTIHDRRRFGSIRCVRKKTMFSIDSGRVGRIWSGGVSEKYVIIIKRFIFQVPWNPECAVFDVVSLNIEIKKRINK